MNKYIVPSVTVIACIAVLGLHHSAYAGGKEDPNAAVVEQSKTLQALLSLPRKPLAERTVVTIYEFESGMQGLTAQAATEMFTTALIKSGQFRVVERARLNDTIVREKQLNGAGQSTGQVAQAQLRGAQFIFDGTISEANASEDQTSGGINIGGFNEIAVAVLGVA